MEDCAERLRGEVCSSGNKTLSDDERLAYTLLCVCRKVLRSYKLRSRSFNVVAIALKEDVGSCDGCLQ